MASVKNELQEILQKKGLPIPIYEELKREGSSHCPVFTVKVTVHWKGGRDMEEIGKGQSKKVASSDAAEKMLAKIRNIEGIPQLSSPSPWRLPRPGENPKVNVTSPQSPSNIKGTLQELLQKEGFPIPRYEEVSATGPPNSRTFTVNCIVSNHDNCTAEESGTGKTKRDAEKSAAQNMMERIEKWLDDDLPLTLLFSAVPRRKTPPPEVIDSDLDDDLQINLSLYGPRFQVEQGSSDSSMPPWLCLVSAENSSVCGVPVTACGVGESQSQAKRQAVCKLIDNLNQLGQTSYV